MPKQDLRTGRPVLLTVQRLATFTGNADPPHLATRLLQPVTDTGRDAARSEHHHVRHTDWLRLLRNSALNLFRRVRPRVPLDDHHAFYGDFAGEAVYFKHLSRLPLVPARDHSDQVVLLDLDSLRSAFSTLLPPLVSNFRHVLDDLRCERNDLHETLIAQLAGDGPEDACPDGFTHFVDEHRGIGVEADIGAILAAGFLPHAHHHTTHYLALLDRGIGRGLFHTGRDHIA